MEENINQQVPQAPMQGGGENKSDAKGIISQFEAFLEEYLVKKAPFAIPAGGKEFIVKVAPYLVIIGAVIAGIGILLGLGLSVLALPFAAIGYATGHGFGIIFIISLLISIVALVMEIIAIPGLFKRTKSAWRLVFYASIVSLIGSIFSISMNYGNGIVGTIIGLVIGWYILFQVKDMYKN